MTRVSPIEGTQRLRAMAFHLPQFHPIRENDEWWGRGFTEWTNVARAKPLFDGHYQPHLPADLGFYDLRLEEVRCAQAEMAREYGVSGFCYWHYWFNGKRLLERPVDEILSTGRPDFPFMLCWANESWTRVWDGGERHKLIEQVYSVEDDRNHIRHLIQFFNDSRYVRVNDKPVFGVYRPDLLPDPSRTTNVWREEASRAGLPGLYLLRLNAHQAKRDVDPISQGFDASVEFQPDYPCYVGAVHRLPPATRIYNRLFRSGHPIRRQHLLDYAQFSRNAAGRTRPAWLEYPCVTPGWDNSPRRRDWANIFVGSTPELYGAWLREVVARFVPPSSDENLIFLNAWNEWAEGNHLEPDQKWGHAYLEATARALRGS